MKLLPERVVTIGVPACNEETVVARALKDLLAQRLPAGVRHEVVVCVNGSTDGTARAVRRLAQNDSRILLIETADAGKNKAMNRIAKAAKGSEIIYCDADMRVGPDGVAKLVAELDSNPGLHAAGVVYSIELGGRSTFAERISSAMQKASPGNALAGGFFAVRRDSLRRLGGFPEHVATDDLWLSRKLGKRRFSIVPNIDVKTQAPRTTGELVKQLARWNKAGAQLDRIGVPGPRLGVKGLSARLKLVALPGLDFSERLALLSSIPLRAYAKWRGRRQAETGGHWKSPERR